MNYTHWLSRKEPVAVILAESWMVSPCRTNIEGSTFHTRSRPVLGGDNAALTPRAITIIGEVITCHKLRVPV